MNTLKKLAQGIGIGLIILVSLPLVLLVLLVVLPMLILHVLTTSVFKLVRRDPRPKFAKTEYIRYKIDDEKEVEIGYQAAYKDAQDFICSHAKGLKIKSHHTQKKVLPEDSPFEERHSEQPSVRHTNYTTVLTSTNKNALEVKLELDYSTGTLGTPESFEIYDDDETDIFTFNISIASPTAKGPIGLYLLDEDAQWMAVAALRGNVKVNRYKQVWFYLEEQGVWAVVYNLGYRSANIGYRKQFSEKRTGRFSLK